MIKKFSDLMKIRLIKNQKEPKDVKWNIESNMKKIIDNKYNVGIPTGIINNIIVVDVDNKDNGIEEFNKYIKEFGEPMTVKQATIGGGFHYIFLYGSTDPDTDYLIRHQIKNRTKYRGVGIDVRTQGGYIVSEPSVVNGKSYKYIRSFDTTPLLEMPTTLVKWLLLDYKKDIKKISKKTLELMKKGKDIIKNEYKYIITDEQIKSLLDKLPDEYNDDYSHWLKITTVLKNLNKLQIWDDWSKKNKKYDELKNHTYWKHNTGCIDINYLIYLVNIVNKTNYKYIDKYKNYIPITTEIIYDIIDMKYKYLYDRGYKKQQFGYKLFLNNDTIIIKSCTGTGKTTAIANHIGKSGDKIISIIARKSLARQHIKTFNDFGVKMHSYENFDKFKDDLDLNTVVCINSLEKYNIYDEKFYNEYVIYIDEVASLIEAITHNDTINMNLKCVFRVLKRMINNAKKVIVSDALINDNVFELLSSRTAPKKLFINNTFKKYYGINAIRIKDENLFLEKIMEHCKNGEYFFFGCDSCSVITDFYNKCYENASEEDKKKFVLITSKSGIVIDDASNELKFKFVFYSPSITYGVDYSINTPQDVFIYITGKSILPSGIFQQTTRTRNINNLYYFCDVNIKTDKYNSLNDVKEYYKMYKGIEERIDVMCLDEEGYKINENNFFNLFTYNEFVKDIYHTSLKDHYENILNENGFIISEIGDNKHIKDDIKENMKTKRIIIENNLIEEYIQTDKKDIKKFDFIRKNIENLNLPLDKVLEYSDIISDNYKITNYFNTITLFKTDDVINDKINMLVKKCFDIKILTMTPNKIKFIRKIENLYKIKPFDVEYFNDRKNGINNIDFSKELFNEYKKIFGSKRVNIPKNVYTLGSIYRDMIRNVVGTGEIFVNKQKKGLLHSSLNNDFIIKNIKLYKFIDSNLKNFVPNIQLIIDKIDF